jgi:hypothetical protein
MFNKTVQPDLAISTSFIRANVFKNRIKSLMFVDYVRFRLFSIALWTSS